MGASTGPVAGPSRVKQIFGGAAGNLVEWYDWYAYSAFALYFAPRFFPRDDALAQQLNGAIIFAIGFLMRPLGGWLLGLYADRHGRKAALTLSVSLMCFGSLMIAVAPTYDQVGLAAPALLLVARLVQGLSVGGEYGASATFMAEVADAKHRGFWASFQYVTLIGGQLVALGVLVTMQATLTEAELLDWGWRVPFVIGALCAVLVFWLRRGLVETEAFQKIDAQARKGLMRRLLAHPRALLTVVALTGGGSLAFYTFTTYMQKYLVLSAGWSKTEATNVSTVALFGYMLLQPVFGALSDRVGRRPLLITFGIGGTLLSVPALTALGTATYPYEGLLLMFSALCVLSCYTAISGLVKAEMFPANIRALGVGLPYAVGVAVFGGTAETVALGFKSAGLEAGFFWYVAAMCGVALVAAWSLPDTKANSRIETE
ncbi:MHS family alpha-ketoglutarate permease-like MFS transporter [Polymorphobacter multimanifer]|uniref:MHS family alpha-ketoglutarate permease-like MFS transporter n=3 Tax=Polymorphobacter multimanifer TaxID=1070431 RepID=A0A841LGA4_9SPHN|nr:MHS family alpha-ketoglutarate permease-like MFS transporter [Polymorphobacter multimanifer]